MNMTSSFLFWAVFASYVVHIIDETLIGGGLVATGKSVRSGQLPSRFSDQVGSHLGMRDYVDSPPRPRSARSASGCGMVMTL